MSYAFLNLLDYFFFHSFRLIFIILYFIWSKFEIILLRPRQWLRKILELSNLKTFSKNKIWQSLSNAIMKLNICFKGKF